MRTIPIVFAFDRNYEMPAGVCITSLLVNASAETFYDIIILHSESEDYAFEPIKKLAEQFNNCKISFRRTGSRFADAFEIRGITKATYYKLLIPELVPEYDKVLYSDVDVIFREDMTGYYDVDLQGYYMAGVNSVPVMNDDYLSYIRKLGLDPVEGYYYAGNLVINSDLVRQDGLVSIFEKHELIQYRFQEMDIINLTCRGRIKQLTPAFCLTDNYYHGLINERQRLKTLYSEEEMDYAINKGIVHYNGPKPWKEVCLNMDIWWEYYRNSIFFDEKFAYEFWYSQTYRIEKMSLWKRIKQVARYFRKGGKK